MEVPTLSGRWVSLEPLNEAHRMALRQAADDERIWRATAMRAIGDGFDAWFETALAERDAGRWLPFAVRRLADMTYVGSTSYLDIMLRHRRLEIGATWYHPESWGTNVNPESKLLLLQHAFDVLGVRRVGFVTDILNRHSQAAIAKLGAAREGILRCHMIAQGGRARDSVVFSIVAEEWPRVRDGLIARVTRTTH